MSRESRFFFAHTANHMNLNVSHAKHVLHIDLMMQRGLSKLIRMRHKNYKVNLTTTISNVFDFFQTFFFKFRL